MNVSDAPVPGQRETDAPGVRGPDRGLSRRQRITQSHLFREAFDRGRRCSGEFMIAWVLGGPEASLRVGVVASKRSFRRAVDRGRAKRLLREAYRLNRFRFRGAWDVILVARRPIMDASRQAVEEDLLKIARKTGLMERGAA